MIEKAPKILIHQPNKHNHKRQDPAPNVHKEMLLAIFIHYEICMSAGAKTENKAKDAHTLKQIFQIQDEWNSAFHEDSKRQQDLQEQKNKRKLTLQSNQLSTPRTSKP